MKVLGLNKKVGVRRVKAKLENGSHLALVDLTQIHYADYQREVVRSHVAKIGERFDLSAVQPISLSYRNGKLWCYDGQHRAHVLLERGIAAFDATILRASYEREAFLFYTANDTPKKMASWKKFDADIKAGNRAKRRALEVIHNAGLTTPLHPDVKKYSRRADFTSCRALQEIIGSGGFALLQRVLKIVKAWRIAGEVPADAKKIDLLRGLAQFIKEYGDSFTDKVLCDVIKRYPPNELRAKANSEKSLGRIDATQFKKALAGIFGVAVPLTSPKAPKSKAA